MTLQDVENEFPNGFHDARMNDIYINYRDRSARLNISVDSSDYDEINEPSYLPITVLLTGLISINVDGPVEYKMFDWKGGPLDISDGPFSVLSANLEPKIWSYKFFVHDWNSFITVIAENAAIAKE
jgi:hypothetical protein